MRPVAGLNLCNKRALREIGAPFYREVRHGKNRTTRHCLFRVFCPSLRAGRLFLEGSLSELIKAFWRADEAWAKELKAVFGDDAVIARYNEKGQGLPGTALRALYNARTLAKSRADGEFDQIKEKFAASLKSS